jgi:hypothetical protein
MKATATQSNTFFPNDLCCLLLVQIFYPNQINVKKQQPFYKRLNSSSTPTTIYSRLVPQLFQKKTKQIETLTKSHFGVHLNMQ